MSATIEATDVPRVDRIDFALLAGNEVAAVMVCPSMDLREVEIKSIKKRWKQRAGVDHHFDF